MKVAVLKESLPMERRAAASPNSVRQLIKAGFEVAVETGAGEGSSYPDRLYEGAGAMVGSRAEVLSGAAVVTKVRPPTLDEVAELPKGCALIAFLWPDQNPKMLEALAARRISALAMDKVPRITRAQRCDALSSMANIAGYRAVVEAANEFGSFFTGQLTAAGRVAHATVLVIGAGVAGLAAIAAAKGLGAVVRAFDTREAVADQVKSLGGEFLYLEFEESGEGAGGYAKVMSEEFIEKEMELFRSQAAEVDIVVTTALIPGKPAPLLWTRDMVEAMKPGSVVVDIAAEQGGNCEVTQADEIIIHKGVKVIGYTDLASRMGSVASDLYGTNIVNVLDEMGNAEGYAIDLDNEIVAGCLVAHDGAKRWPPEPLATVDKPKPAPRAKMPTLEREVETFKAAEPDAPRASWGVALSILAIGFVAGWLYLRYGISTKMLSPQTREFLQHLTVFVLACFVGWQIIWNVTPALHTPLMAVTNAISGIIIVGGILQLYGSDSVALGVGVAATFFAMINVLGGFYVTQRMLHMFRK
jgi:NAD(P) transhydrogenase subunit alpha